MANLPGTAQQAYISLQAYLGSSDFAHQTLIDLVTPTTLTSIAQAQAPLTVLAAASYTAFNLASYFPAVINSLFIAVFDQTVPTQTFGISTVNGSGSQTIAPGLFWAYCPNGGAPPTIYLSNVNATNGLLQCVILTN